jgi:hypothetical protein
VSRNTPVAAFSSRPERSIGIDHHGLNFLLFAKKRKPFRRTVTIGRKGLHVIAPVVRDLVGASAGYKNEPSCETVIAPTNGRCVGVTSRTGFYVLARTVRTRQDISHPEVQQSDYVSAWAGETTAACQRAATESGGLKAALKRLPAVHKTLSPLYRRHLRRRPETGLNQRNSGLRATEIHAWV